MRITSTLLNSPTLIAALTAAAIAALSFLSILTFFLSTLSFCSHKHASFIGKYDQHGGADKALKHATNCGASDASTCLVVGYCHKMTIS